MDYKAISSVMSSPSPTLKACKSELTLVASVKCTWKKWIVKKS